MSRKKSGKPKVSRSVLEMTAKQARVFFLKPESYCSLDLPPYFVFSRILSAVSKNVLGKTLAGMSSKPRDHEGVNYSMLSNKDGRHAWRPFQLIHPALYISLVDQMTQPANWKLVRARFKEFKNLPNFKCLSISVEASSSTADRAAQVRNWWLGIEQGSIKLALDFNYVVHADITDCYSDIYTHSIAWALHTKSVAKAKKGDKSLLGNVIDSHIQDMRHGQTNGIPQGSVLMDFIAELVLGYADLNLSMRLEKAGIAGNRKFQILRYRDDYRIFVQNPQLGETILKCLTEVLIDLGLKLNTGKTTTGSLQVVASSIKADKRVWLRGRQGDRNLQKHLLVIHAHGIDFPNTGSLTTALAHFHRRLTKAKRIQNPHVLVSIATDIAYNSPRTFPVCAAIVSKLLPAIQTKDDRVKVIRKIYRKLSQLPNTGHMEVWLQRISHPLEPRLKYEERLCKLVKNRAAEIWNNDWITSVKLKAALDPSQIVNKSKLRSLEPVIKPAEVALFRASSY